MDGQKLKLMVVEDEVIIAEGLKCCIKQLGHTVVAEAGNGEDAVALARVTDLDCLLMDINLPGIDGITALTRIRETKDVSCIFISGYSDAATVEAATSAGAFGYLVKPVDINDLRAALWVVINRHRDFVSLREEAQASKRALQERKIVERAKGVLMEEMGLTEKQAMEFLQKKSRNSNKKLAVVAQRIVDLAVG